MTAFIIGTLALLTLLVGLLLAAQVEFAHQLEDVRRAQNIGGRPRLLTLKHPERKLPLELLGNPSVAQGRAELFFTSPSCFTCEGIASLLAGDLPATTWLVVDRNLGGRAAAPLQALIDEAGDRVLTDDGSLADALGVHVTPSVVVIEDAIPQEGYAISTVEQFHEIVRQPKETWDYAELASV